MRFELDGKDFKEVEHLPSKQENRDHNNHDGKGFAKIEPGAAGLQTPGYQAQNVERGESENQHPQDRIEIIFLFRIV